MKHIELEKNKKIFGIRYEILVSYLFSINAKNQSLVGNIECDNISTVTINLTEGSSLKSTINSDKTAKSIVLKLDSSSKLKLTGDCYVTSLDDADTSYSNIDFNGFTLYVNGSAIN